MSTPHVQLLIDPGTPTPQPLQTALRRLNARVSVRTLDSVMTGAAVPQADLCVLLPGADRSPDTLQKFLEDHGDRAFAALVIRHGGSGTVAAPSFEEGLPVNRLVPARRQGDELNADELTGRLKALWEVRHRLRGMQEEIRRLRLTGRSPRHTDGGIEEQLRLAGQIQRDLLPQNLPSLDPLRLHILYLPADHVSGDTYDVARLDENHFSFSLADATGHGLPAALLAILVKNSLRGKEIYNGSYRIIEPDELLSRMNAELLNTTLQDGHFITAVHAIIDRSNMQLRWARGGMPYPVLLRRGQAPRQLPSNGGILGAFEAQTFEVAHHRLLPGDSIIFYSDGLEALLLDRREAGGHRAFISLPWLRTFTEGGPEPALEEIRRLAESRNPADWPRDDITAIIVEHP